MVIEIHEVHKVCKVHKVYKVLNVFDFTGFMDFTDFRLLYENHPYILHRASGDWRDRTNGYFGGRVACSKWY